MNKIVWTAVLAVALVVLGIAAAVFTTVSDHDWGILAISLNLAGVAFAMLAVREQ